MYSGGNSDPHLQAFTGQQFEFCGTDRPECKGQAFAIASEARMQVNAEVDRLAGPDAWPAAGTWITGLGLRSAAGAGMAVELRMRKDAAYTVVPEGGKTRALQPEGAPKGAAGLRALLAAASVNGEDVLGKVGSGETLDLGGGNSVHLPANTHTGDATDGPVMVVKTPDTTWTWYLESEDTWHLDFKVALNAGNAITRMHGLLGQTLHWARDSPAVLEGGDELRYAVRDGLLGSDFAFNLFGKAGGRAPAGSRRELTQATSAGLAAGSPAALALV
ncbi:MAG: hypothetical protein J3K34DRAFT_524055 [Monoraphidium minutum]|nr:MAG: hypothetical protein J3K34DRAFT_524055 [Monoraphidium minutum]